MVLLQCAQYLSLSLAGQPQNLVGTQTSSLSKLIIIKLVSWQEGKVQEWINDSSAIEGDTERPLLPTASATRCKHSDKMRYLALYKTFLLQRLKLTEYTLWCHSVKYGSIREKERASRLTLPHWRWFQVARLRATTPASLHDRATHRRRVCLDIVDKNVQDNRDCAQIVSVWWPRDCVRQDRRLAAMNTLDACNRATRIGRVHFCSEVPCSHDVVLGFNDCSSLVLSSRKMWRFDGGAWWFDQGIGDFVLYLSEMFWRFVPARRRYSSLGCDRFRNCLAVTFKLVLSQESFQTAVDWIILHFDKPNFFFHCQCKRVEGCSLSI